MRKKVIIISITSVALSVLACAFFPRQPSYQGTKLRVWLDVLYPPSGSSIAENQLAEKAVQEIGQDGLPWLVGWLTAKEGRLGRMFAEYGGLLPFGVCRLWRPAVDHNAKAVPAFKVLGRVAEPAIPQLLGVVTNATDLGQAVLALEALCAIGSERSFDAVMSLSSSRPRPMFTEQFLRNTFISRNPAMAKYAQQKLGSRRRE